MEIILTNFLGGLLGIAVAMVFFRTFWVMKKIKPYMIIGGVLFIAIANVVLASLLLNTAILPAVTVVLTLILSFCFTSTIRAKIMFSLVVTAILFTAELLAGIAFINILELSLDQVQYSEFLYFIGVVASNLIALVIVLFVRIIMQGYKKESDNQFNLLMLFMPMQAIIICFIVYFYSISAGEVQASPFGMVAILVSLSLVFITMFIIKNLQKAIAYKNDYELARERLGTQLEQYQKLHQQQIGIRKIRHDISNNLIAITGTLEDGRIKEAIDRINSISLSIGKSETIADTGTPELDAVINAKYDMANKSGIRITDKINIDYDLKIDGFDLACVVASALDNAIEGILRSSDDVEKNIDLIISNASEYVSVLVENYTSGPVYEGFQTSKPDKANHGFGLAQMRAIANKYDGNVQPKYDTSNMMFSLTILLRNSKT